MRSTNACTGQHRDGGLWNHGHVQSDEIAFANSHGLERVGSTAHLGMQLLVGEGAHISGFALPDQGCFGGLGAIQMTVKAVVREVGGSALKPACKRRIIPVENSVKWFKPMQFTTRCVSPECIWIRFGCFSESVVRLHPRNSRISGEVRWWIKNTLFLKHTLNGGTLTHRLLLKCTDSTTLSTLTASGPVALSESTEQ